MGRSRIAWGVVESRPPRVGATSRIRTRRRLGAASPKPASGGYIDWKCVKGRTSRSATLALSSAQEELAGDRARRNDRLHQVADVRNVLDERPGVPAPLEDDALGLLIRRR
jgi:hypothetical protein